MTALKQTPGSIDFARGEIARQTADLLDIDRGDPFEHAWVREMFDGSAIVEARAGDDETAALYEVEWRWGPDRESVMVAEPVEVTVEYVAKAEGGPRLTGPIVRKDAEKRIVWGAVLVPGEPDDDGETLTAEKVEEAGHTWLEDFRAIDRQHSIKVIDASPVESYISPTEQTVEVDGRDVTLPAGTWIVAAKVRDDTVWSEIKRGRRTGFSVMGVPRARLEAAMSAVKSGDTAGLKRVTLADVGGGDPNGDWVAPFVSIVAQPAVPKAKFFAMKAADDDPGFWRRIFGAGDSAGKEGRRISERNLSRLKTASEAIQELVAEAEQERELRRAEPARDKEEDMDSTEIRTIASEAATEAVKSALAEQLGGNDDKPTLKTAIKEAVDEALAARDETSGKTGDGNGAGDGTGDGDGGDGEQENAALKARVEKLEQRLAAGSRQIDDDAGDAAEKAKPAARDVFGKRITV